MQATETHAIYVHMYNWPAGWLSPDWLTAWLPGWMLQLLPCATLPSFTHVCPQNVTGGLKGSPMGAAGAAAPAGTLRASTMPSADSAPRGHSASRAGSGVVTPARPAPPTPAPETWHAEVGFSCSWRTDIGLCLSTAALLASQWVASRAAKLLPLPPPPAAVCNPGWGLDSNSSRTCNQQCSMGTASPGGLDAVCSACPPGSYAFPHGASSCSLCPAGSYSNTSASYVCTGCLAGWYSPTAGSTSCTPCPTGYNNWASRSSTCTGAGVQLGGSLPRRPFASQSSGPSAGVFPLAAAVLR